MKASIFLIASVCALAVLIGGWLGIKSR